MRKGPDMTQHSTHVAMDDSKRTIVAGTLRPRSPGAELALPAVLRDVLRCSKNSISPAHYSSIRCASNPLHPNTPGACGIERDGQLFDGVCHILLTSAAPCPAGPAWMPFRSSPGIFDRHPPPGRGARRRVAGHLSGWLKGTECTILLFQQIRATLAAESEPSAGRADTLSAMTSFPF